MDQAGYRQNHHLVWTNVQAQATSRVDLFANLVWTRNRAAIEGLEYEPGPLEAQLVGLDYRLMSSAFSGFSDLKIGQFVQTAGVHYRLSERVVLTGTVEVNRYDDREPYLFDATGRYVSFAAGLQFVF